MKKLLNTIHNIKARYFNRQPRSLMYQWTISYISVLLLPLLIFSFYYVHTYRVIKESSESNQKLILENASEQLNYIFYDSLTLSNTLVLNKYVRSLSFNDPIMTNNSILERHYLSKELHSIKASNRLIEDIIIYFPHTDYLVSTNSAHQASLLTNMNRTPVYQEDLTLLCNVLKENNMVCLQSGTTSSLLLAHPLLVSTDNEILSLTLIQVNKKNLRNQLQNSLLSDNQSSFALINEKDVLLSFGKDIIMKEDTAANIWNYFSDRSDISTFNHEYELDNQTCILNFKASLFKNGGLISITEKSVYNITIYQLLENMLISLIFCLLLGLGVTLYYSRKNYRPVSQIMNYIDRESEDLSSNNEYQLITRFLKKKQNELEYQRSLLRNNYIMKLLSGEIPASQMSPQFSLHFSSVQSCVIGIRVNPESVTEYASDNGQLLHFIIQNILSELLNPVFPEHDYCIASQHEIFVLVSIPSDPPNHNYLKEIQRVVNELYQILSTNYDIEFIAGISNTNSNDAIPDSRIQVNSILEYLRLFGQSKVSTYNELHLSSDLTAIHLNTQDYVQNLLISGSVEQLDDYFSLIYCDIKSKNLSTSDAKNCFYFFYLTTIQICCFCQTHYAFTPNSLDPVNDKTYFSKSLLQSLETIHASYRDFITEFSDFRDIYESNGWGNDICRYIENNYFDVNLNLNNVAEHCSLTPAYLSKKFKEKFNKSVNDYLYEIRINHARQLLTDTNLNMSEIAQMTGFIDSSSFIRIFKKYVGITPGKYKTSDLPGNK